MVRSQALGGSMALEQVIAANFLSLRDDWETPNPLFRKISDRYGPFDHDVAAVRKTAKVPSYLGPDHWNPQRRDALRVRWRGKCWCNPPYGPGITSLWVERAWHQARLGNASTVLLVPGRSSTSWYHRFCLRADEICQLEGRIGFEGAGSAPFDSILVCFWARERKEDGSPADWDMFALPKFTRMSVPAEVRGKWEDDDW